MILAFHTTNTQISLGIFPVCTVQYSVFAVHSPGVVALSVVCVQAGPNGNWRQAYSFFKNLFPLPLFQEEQVASY